MTPAPAPVSLRRHTRHRPVPAVCHRPPLPAGARSGYTVTVTAEPEPEPSRSRSRSRSVRPAGQGLAGGYRWSIKPRPALGQGSTEFDQSGAGRPLQVARSDTIFLQLELIYPAAAGGVSPELS